LPGGGAEHHDPKTNLTVRTDRGGRVTQLEGPNSRGVTTRVSRMPMGERVVVTGERGNRVVSYGPNHGFIERRTLSGYLTRTHMAGGRLYAHAYFEYRYRGFAYARYVPAFYYGPRFYAWSAAPWGVPVVYAWSGFAVPAPWLGFYAGYFSPYPAYSSPDLWLTDYLINENLKQTYEASQGDQNPQPPGTAQPASPVLTAETKELIAAEVRRQLAEAAASTQSPVAPTGSELAPPTLSQTYFVVASFVDIVPAGTQGCSLTPGDVIQRTGKTVAPDGNIDMKVVSAKPGGCAANSEAAISLSALQEMHNQFREQIDGGLTTLAANEGNRFPAAPPTEARAVPEGTVTPVADAASLLADQEASANKMEDIVRQGGNKP